jgi:dolichol kinase
MWMEKTTRAFTGSLSIPAEVRTEVIRKSLHALIALVPGIASAASAEVALGLLASGSIIYTYAEMMRRSGTQVAVISRITALASRDRDLDRFVLGPLTLALGAMMALMLYPAAIAAIAIYALAFGDGLASLIGKFGGRTVLPFTGGKTLEGSLACMLAVLTTTYAVTNRALESLAIAVAATILEAFPTNDMDNFILPVGVGAVATIILVV